MRYFRLIINAVLFLTVSSTLAKDGWVLRSPDKQFSIRLMVKEQVYYSVIYKGKEIISPSVIALVLEDRVLGKNAKVKDTKRRNNNSVITLPYGNFRELSDHYNELEVVFEDGYAVILRAYNEGVCYRLKTNLSSNLTVVSEEANFNLTGSPSVLFPESDVYTSWEVPYRQYPSVDSISDRKRAITPVMFSYPDVKVLIAESDVIDYPGMYLSKVNGSVKGSWASFPKRTELGSWGNFVSVVKETESFIAKTSGARSFPWRVVIASDDDKSFLTNKLIYKLARPLEIDATWVKPGKATWEWWHDAIVEDAPVPSGMNNRNTALYKHYIDFAAANQLEYLMLDAGWSDIFHLERVNSRVDVQELIQYGKSKNVGVFLWCVATAIIDDLDGNMKLLKDWGAAGIKVDFIDRDDQQAMTWFEKIAASAAKHQLMVNFHGCSKPTGLERAYPNIVNYEAVRGAECSKWDYTANPDHHLIIPFTRMIAGPLDYTPGSMRNKTKDTFKPIDPGLPSTQGTRCHELAMYVLYDQPFAMLCDAPAEYRKYPDVMKYLSEVPTSFDDTKVLDAKVGEYAVVAKRQDNKWYVGAMTNWEGRSVVIDFSFLPAEKRYKAHLYTDGQQANQDASAYEYKVIEVDHSTKLKVEMANGGGAVVYVE